MRRIILGPVVFVLLVVGISLPTLIAFPFNVVIAAAAGLAVSLVSDRIIYIIVGKTKPTLLVEPLQILSFGAGANLERSQWVNMARYYSRSGGSMDLW